MCASINRIFNWRKGYVELIKFKDKTFTLDTLFQYLNTVNEKQIEEEISNIFDKYFSKLDYKKITTYKFIDYYEL